jgi:hypothetical protein
MLDLCHWLETTSVGTVVRESLYGFPILVGLHILGLIASVGVVLWFDLRLLGLALPAVPASHVYRRLMPWAAGGFALMAVTGGLLFVGYASTAYVNVFFRIKFGAMLLAGVNALVYHRVTERTRDRWDAAPQLPAGARAAGLVSLLVWTIVIVSGRMMAYTMY